MTNKQQQMMEYFKKDRFAASIGIKLIEVEPGYALAQLEICENHLNAIDSVQGGVTFTLADFAFGVASNSYGQVAVGINVSITYFRPPKGKVLIAEAKEIYANSKLASYNVDVFDDNKDVIVANFIGMVYRKKDQLIIY